MNSLCTIKHIDYIFYNLDSLLHRYFYYDLLPTDFIVSNKIQTCTNSFLETSLVQKANTRWLHIS